MSIIQCKWSLSIFDSLPKNLVDEILPDFPPIKPSAIALGVVFKYSTQLLFGVIVEGTVHRDEIRERLNSVQPSDKPFHDHTVTDDIAHHSSGLTASAFQTYALAALLSASGTLSYKGATYVGALVYFASSVPGVSNSTLISRTRIYWRFCQLLHQTIVQKKPFHIALVDVSSHVVETVGLSLFLTYWGINTGPLPRRAGNLKFSADF